MTPTESCLVTEGASIRDLAGLVRSGESSSYIARGLGRAYGDSSLNRNQGVLNQTHRNRFVAFNSESGILTCEAGTSLREILACFLPRGWTLPVTPGTKDVTVGGAIAADVHGKNHHVDGSFGNYVTDLDLLTASGSIVNCSPSHQQATFWATVGGMGLTGIILRASIRLRQVESAYCHVTYQRTKDLDETLACFQDKDHGYRFSVAWIDCLARGACLGRSVVMLANDAKVDELPVRVRQTPLILPARRPLGVPCNLPSATLNSWSVGAFNAMYYGRHPSGTAVVDLDSFFYPLDRISHWNRIYGRRGFYQYQALFPTSTSHQGLVELLQAISEAQCASFLAVLKSCGEASRGTLSFLRPGHTLALDIPNDGDNVAQLVRQLDRIVLKFGGRLYLAKDAVTTKQNFAAMYPELAEFQRLKAALDPTTRFSSSQARRLGIVEDSVPANRQQMQLVAC